MAKINCDMGESFGIYAAGNDEEIMPLIDIANVACGFHASDPNHMRKTVELAKKNNVRVGAHPSLPDLQGFGRREMKLTSLELTNTIIYQVGALKAFLDEQNMQLNHIKPHGALYGMDMGWQSSVMQISPPLMQIDSVLTYEINNDAFGPDTISWTYEDDFFSHIQSGVVRLPNGNTLVTVAMEMRIFEITNDGDIAKKLTHPSYKIKKIYSVRLEKKITNQEINKIKNGVIIDNEKILVDKIQKLEKSNEIGIEIHIGKNRIVRKIFETLNHKVIKLDRVMFGPLTKKDLPRGKWRRLSQKEIINLKSFSS